jgi:hypothetical protein
VIGAHPYAFSNTKNVEFHAVKYNENEAHLIASGARSPYYPQGLAAGKSCFVDEVLPLCDQFVETNDDLLSSSQTCGFRSLRRNSSSQYVSIDEFALDLRAYGFLVNGRFAGSIGAAQNGA